MGGYNCAKQTNKQTNKQKKTGNSKYKYVEKYIIIIIIICDHDTVSAKQQQQQQQLGMSRWLRVKILIGTFNQ